MVDIIDERRHLWLLGERRIAFGEVLRRGVKGSGEGDFVMKLQWEERNIWCVWRKWSGVLTIDGWTGKWAEKGHLKPVLLPLAKRDVCGD